eukprot:15366694-Ditylum_brightwellii.AAC.1
MVLIQSIADSIHREVLDSNNNPVPTLYTAYIDDNLISDIGPRMKQAMSASIEAVFSCMDYPKSCQRRNIVYIEKFLAAQCSYKKK